MKKNFFLSSAIVLLAPIGSIFAQATHAYIWDATNGPRDLGTLGGDSFAYAVNDSATVVGVYIPLDKFNFHGFIWTEATGMVDLGIPGGGDSETAECVPGAINSAGNVVGYARQVDGRQVAFFWTSSDGFTTLGDASTNQCDSCNGAFAINDLNQVTGHLLRGHNFSSHAFLWEPGRVHPQDLGTIDGEQSSTGLAINNLGRIVGAASSSFNWAPMIWSRGRGMQFLGEYGSLFAQAQAVNDASEVVGLDETGTRDLAWYTSPETGLTFLEGLGGNSTSANAINQQGVIVGYSIEVTNVQHGVMWPTPTSPPVVLPLENCYGINNVGQVVGWAAAAP
jgi:probable HAF family extracellular repeat protein